MDVQEALELKVGDTVYFDSVSLIIFPGVFDSEGKCLSRDGLHMWPIDTSKSFTVRDVRYGSMYNNPENRYYKKEEMPEGFQVTGAVIQLEQTQPAFVHLGVLVTQAGRERLAGIDQRHNKTK